jgi:hypothetical protein
VLVIAAVLALHVSLIGANHHPKVNAHWRYTVTAKLNGKPVAAKLTMQIVDPIGGVHGVQRGPSTKYVTRWPFKGVYRDYIIWPPDSRGFTLKLRATVVVGRRRAVATYAVTPR